METIEGKCAVTLPIPDLGNRLLTVYIEPTASNSFLVHDGGRTFSQLYSLGVHIGYQRINSLDKMASRLGATFSKYVFQALCRQSEIPQTVLTISQCASITMIEILKHKKIMDAETLKSRASKTLDSWMPDYIAEIRMDWPVKGIKYRHTVDFVTFPQNGAYRPVIVKIIKPTYSAEVQSRAYGFFALDIQGTRVEDYPRLAIITRAEEWKMTRINLVRRLSSSLIRVRTNEEKSIEIQLPKEMDRLSSLAD